MLSRTGVRACLTVGQRRIPASLRYAPRRLQKAEKTCQPPTVDYGCVRHFATAPQQPEELTTMYRAIEQGNMPQARKSFAILRNTNQKAIDRGAIQKLLKLLRSSKKQSDLAFIQEVVDAMESQLNIPAQHFEYHTLMYAYGVQQRPESAERVLKSMDGLGVKPNTYTYNTLLGCYKRVNDEASALRILEKMQEKGIQRDLVTYNTLLHFVDRKKVLPLYSEMQRDKIKPDGFTYSTVLSVATRERNTEVGDNVFRKVLADPNAVDTATINSILAYKAMGADDFKKTLNLYESLGKRFPNAKADTITYNTMLDACLKHNRPESAYAIFDQMINAGYAPDVITYGTLIDAEARQRNTEGALKLFNEMTYRSIDPNERVLSTLANSAAHTTDPKVLTDVCNTIRHYSEKYRLDAKAYNGLLSGLAKHGRSAQAQKLYDDVFRHNSRDADIATYTNLMLAYINDNQLNDAMDIYYVLREHCQNAEPGAAKVTLDATFYTTLISAMTALPGQDIELSQSAPNYAYMVDDKPDYVENLDGTSQPNLLRALTLFNDMRRLLIRPNAHVYTAMLHACAQYRDAYALEQIHRLIRMDLYFDPDTAVYNALMDAYNRVGDGHTVMQLWDILMLSSAPETAIDQATISVVLDSCGHNGYGYRARDIWRRVKRAGFDLNTNNYNSYIECLCRSRGRAGWDEARRVAQEEMRSPEFDDPRPPIEEKTINTLISFARKKAFAPEEVEELEAWKKKLFS